MWAPQVAGLADAADCWIHVPTGSDSMRGLAEEVLAAAPFPRFALAGHSMGSYIAFEIMRLAPERVTCLALLNTTARPDTPEHRARRAQNSRVAESEGVVHLVDSLIPALLGRRAADAGIAATLRTMARNIGVGAFVRHQRAIMARPDSRPGLAAIRCPTVVLCGSDDTVTGQELHEEAAALIAGAVLQTLDDCAHLVTLENAAGVNAAMRRWLSN
jgi:pimeloyl-ACP methyl ester carboxylesterase